MKEHRLFQSLIGIIGNCEVIERDSSQYFSWLFQSLIGIIGNCESTVTKLPENVRRFNP